MQKAKLTPLGRKIEFGGEILGLVQTPQGFALGSPVVQGKPGGRPPAEPEPNPESDGLPSGAIIRQGNLIGPRELIYLLGEGPWSLGTLRLACQELRAQFRERPGAKGVVWWVWRDMGELQKIQKATGEGII